MYIECWLWIAALASPAHERAGTRMFRTARHALRSAALLGIAFGAASRVAAGPLGVAGDYNEFILGNANQAWSNIEGGAAVGGNLNLNGVSIAANRDASATNVVVGGSLAAKGGSIKGSTIAGGNIAYETPNTGKLSANGSVTLTGWGGAVNGGVNYGTTFSKPPVVTVSGPITQQTTTQPINFANEFAYLTALSQAQLAGSVAATYQWSQLFFNGGSGLNLFSVTEAQFETAWGGFNIDAPAGATVIINVAGHDLNSVNTGYHLTGGITADHVLFNFYEATTLTLNGSITGTILATAATVIGGAEIQGSVIAAAINGPNGAPSQVNLKWVPFMGEMRQLPVPSPEPANLGLLLAGLGMVGIGRWRMSRRRMQRAA